MGNVSIIIVKSMVLIDGVLAAKNNEFLNLEIECYLKVKINYYKKKSIILNYIILLMKDVWKWTHDLNIYNCHEIY